MKLEAFWIMNLLCTTEDDEKLKVFMGLGEKHLLDKISYDLKSNIWSLIDWQLRGLIADSFLDYRLFTMILWAVGNIASVTDERTKQEVLVEIMDYSCILDAI